LLKLNWNKNKKKPTRRRQTHLQKDKPIASTDYTRRKRRRKTALLELTDSEEENLKDSEIETAVNNLQNVLEYTQMQCDNGISSNIFDCLAWISVLYIVNMFHGLSILHGIQ